MAYYDARFIETIVRAVLQTIEQEGGRGAENLPEVLVLSARKSRGFEQIVKKLGKCARLVAMDDLCRNELAEPGKRFKKIVIATLCPVGMADLALGRATGREMLLLLELLLKGHTVEVGEYTYEKYKNSASPQLYKLYQQYEKRLEQFGLRRLSPLEQMSLTKLTEKRRLVTETMLAAMGQENGVVELPKGVLITALARDYAKEHGIVLKIQGEKEVGSAMYGQHARKSGSRGSS